MRKSQRLLVWVTCPEVEEARQHAARLAGIPDLQVAVEATVASNDMVAASFVYTGTHTGTLFAVAPTGRSIGAWVTSPVS